MWKWIDRQNNIYKGERKRERESGIEKERGSERLERRETSNECQKNSSSFQCDNERDISYIWSEKAKFMMGWFVWGYKQTNGEKKWKREK